MPSNRVTTETIDEVVIRLLGLSPGMELDYETYYNLIKKKLISVSVGRSIPQDELEPLRSALKVAQKKKASKERFKINQRRARVTRTSQGKINAQKLLPQKGALVKTSPNKIVPQDVRGIKPVTVKDITPKHPFASIREPLDSIFNILQSRFKFDQKEADKKRKEDETKKRGKRESTLEGFKKGIGEIVSATKKMLAPFEEIINRITRFIFFTLLGRAFTGFLEWMKDKGNQEKFNSLIEFLSKHWPAIAGLYILFGTSLGKLIRGIVKLSTRMIVALAVNIPKLFSFIKKNKKLALLGAGAASYLSGRVGEPFGSKETPETSSIKPSTDLGEAQKDVDKTRATPAPTLNQFNVGGIIPKEPIKTYNDGGVVSKKPLKLNTFNLGGINPFNGLDLSSGVPIEGAGPDNTLIAAKTDEAILTVEDQVDLAQRYVDKETGQPLNIPQYLSGRKPGQVSFSKLRFPTIGKGFFKGGVIPQFNVGGIVGKPTTNIPNQPNILTSIEANPIVRNIQNVFGNVKSMFTGKPKTKTKPKAKPVKLEDFELPEAQSLLGTIRAAEHYKKTKNPYDVVYGGGTAPITQMTVQEVINMYDARKLPTRLGGTPVKFGSGSGAMGAYQFMPHTLEDLIRRGEVKPTQVLTPKLQDKLGWALARNRGVTIKMLQQSGLSQGVLDLIAPEWASLPHSGSGGKSFYGQPVKSVEFLKGVFKSGIKKKQAGGLIDNHKMSSSFLSIPNTREPSSVMQTLIGEKNTIERPTNISFGGAIKNFFLGKRSEPTLDVKENEGYNIPGATADRQLTALQPGEYVLPRRVVHTLGLPLVEEIVRKTDSNSAAFLKKGTIRTPEIQPYSSGYSMSTIIELPPIASSAGGPLRPRASGLGGGSQVPSFSATAPDNERDKNAAIYELVG